MIYHDLSPSMQKHVQRMAVVLLAGLVLSSFAFAFSHFASTSKIAQEKRSARTITVSGEGKISVRPDIATFTVGVTVEAEKVGDAQLQNTRRANAILEFLIGQGVDKKDLKTIRYSINPQYQYTTNKLRTYPSPDRRREIVAYEVRNTIEVKVRDLEKIDELLEGVVINGANEVGSIRFTVDDEEKVKMEARREAIKDAKTKAKILAKDLGVRLGKIAAFSESGGGIPIYARAFAEADFGVSAAPQTEPGEQEIRSFVTVTYEFK